jgi:uncharacterized protein (DUF1697 family)
MEKYLLFLRGINVGGQKIIRMNDLRQSLTSFGFINVQTYIQSGNVSIDTDITNIDYLQESLESYLEIQLGLKTKVMIREFYFLQEIVKRDPFKNFEENLLTKFYISFLESSPKFPAQLPLIKSKEGLELFRLDEKEAYLVSKRIKGRYGFPNNFIEKELNITATTRNWTTIRKITQSIQMNKV